MEKIINITIGNFTFTIEEPAFDILKKYLNDLEIHFSATEGKEEIISDIEIRIGELLNQKVSEAKKVVNAADIIQVIEQMGNPSDIGEGESQEQEKSTYENRNYSTYRRRRVFRDPDNSKIGGVCGGVAAYFDIDPVWLRLAFVISVFFFGTGVLLYIILWVVLPEANTASEKLEMRGEPIDVNNIEKTIKENLKKVKSDFKDYYQKEGKQNMRKGGALASSFLADLFHQVGFIILRIVGGFLLLLGLILLVLWIKTMAFSTSNGFSGFITGVFSESWQKELSIIAILTFVAIPLLSLCYGGFQMLFGIRYRNKPIKYTFNILSTLAIITIVYLGYVTFENFSTTGSNTSTTKITNMDSTKTINISFNEDEYFDNDQ
ncbi:MAG: PspC domain-containing protein, partial [Bacteroidetes bacterium]|nr:PspC domain-containing protein [Bacteroidota bacterium]